MSIKTDKKKSRDEKTNSLDNIRFTIELSPENIEKLEGVRGLTGQKTRKVNAEKLLDAVLNFSNKKVILPLMLQENLDREAKKL